MDKLRRQIIKYFILCSFGIATLTAMLNGLYDEIFHPDTITDLPVLLAVIASDLAIWALIYFLFALLFFVIIRRKIKKETQRQMEEKNILYANIAHDLKTPITSILGFSKALKDGAVEESRRDEIIDIIYEKSRQTDDMINRLFHYSKLETDSYALSFEKLDVCAPIRAQVAEAYPEFEAAGIALQVEIPEEPITAKLDIVEFRRAVNNLIENAYKHNPKGTAVLISVEEVSGVVRVTIADNGEPIDRALADRIFQPFVCGNESRSIQGGTGLGLAISRKIIEKHGGTLRLQPDFLGFTKAFVIELKKT
jgi:signal transduction histidine kinase